MDELIEKIKSMNKVTLGIIGFFAVVIVANLLGLG
jgi:hypothetical protein